MRRLLCLLLLAASLLGQPGPAAAQSDPGDRLSLEALTAPQAGDGRGYHSRRSYSRGISSRRSYRGSYRRYHATRTHRRRSYGGYRRGRTHYGHVRHTHRHYRGR